MTDVLDAIKDRRSIRRYKNDPIPDLILGQLLEAVRWSPSWANTQCWEVIVVKDPGQKAGLQATLGRNPAFDAMVDAPVIFVLCARLEKAGFKKGESTTKFGDWFMYDLGLANQNLCLAAHALGLGTVIVGLFDHDKTRKVLDVPEGYEVVSMVPTGYPASEAVAPRRREVEEFHHNDKFYRRQTPFDN